jgi:hypothetical protein
MVDYDYNRAAFRSVYQSPGVRPLALAYCSCVLLELSLKQHLGLISSPMNQGHDLPQLVHRLGLRNSKHLFTCNALQVQLRYALTKLFSQGKDGTPRTVPGDSYPHLRYLRHSSDWPQKSSPDQDIATVNSLIQRIISFLSNNVGVAV